MDIKIIEKMNCRSNKVYLAVTSNGDKVVFKRNKSLEGVKLEAQILNILSVSGYAPNVLEQKDDYIIYEYVEGALFMDKYLEYTMRDDKEGLIRLANELSVYLQIFYSLTDGIILKDISFNNFIIKDGRCYGIDYDAVGEGMQYTDIAGIVAFAAYHAVGGITGSFPFIRTILINFHLDMMDIINDVREYLLESNELVDVDGMLDILLNIDDSALEDIKFS